tara:strand:+ start:543 stop:815 length:273 start_codon:yes stop_codon:yes gene_type:complete
MTVLPREASYGQFRDYVVEQRGALSCAEIDDLWARRQRLHGIGFVTGRGYRSTLPPDEQHLTREERGRKTEENALAQGRNIERLPDKATF